MTTDSPRQAILFLTHRLDRQIVSRFERIDLAPSFDKYILLDHTAPAPVIVRSDLPIVPFDFQQICDAGYKPIRPGRVTPGSNHFPVIEFGSVRPEYSFIWVVEFDVVYTGKWANIFQSVESKADLIATNVRRFQNHPHWPYWRMWNNSQPDSLKIPRLERIASFNPIYRLSRSSLQYLRKSYLAGWCGHHEVTMASLLHRGGFGIEELGGSGEFTPIYRQNTLYRIGDTMRWRPNIRGNSISEPNMLYHPVKF